MSLAPARVGLRLARREVRRHPWRSALVLLMALVPTFAMTVAATLLRTGEWSGEDQQAAEFGQADAIAWPVAPRWQVDGPTTTTDPEADGRLLASFPAGDVVIAHNEYDRVRTEDRRAYLTVTDLPLDNPIVDGRFAEVDGRVPEGPDETVISSTLADELDVGVGDVIAPQRLGVELTVVGITDRLEYDDDLAFVTSIDDRSIFDETQAFIDLDGPLGDTFPEVRGWSVSPVIGNDTPHRARFDGESNTDGVFWTYLGGAVALLVLSTVIAAAFAVGARRQLRTIGLLSSTGASPTTVRWYLLAQGVVGGGIGATLGVSLGVLATRLVPEQWLEALIDRRVDGPVTRLADVLPIILIGTLAAVGAAWLPARTVARVPTLQALAGRRPQGRVPRLLPILGVVAIVGGCGLLAAAVAANDSASTPAILIAVGGSVAILVGTLAIGPWAIAGLERISGRLPESGRLAGRSLARSRLRSAAVVGAICAVTATLIAGTTLYRTFNAEDTGNDFPYVPAGIVHIESSGALVEVDAVAEQARALVPGSELVEVPVLRGDGARPNQSAVYVGLVDDQGTGNGNLEGGDYRVAIGTPDLLDVYEVPDDLREALADGQAISVDGVDAAGATWVEFAVDDGRPATRAPFGGSFDSPAASYVLPRILVSESTADELGLAVLPRPPRVLDADRGITDGERHALDLLADDISWAQVGNETDPFYVSFSSADGQPKLTPTQIRALGYLAIILLIGAVVAVGLALSARDDKDEAQVLTAVGAPPRVVRRVAAMRAGFLVLTATAIALPAGLLPAAAIVQASWRDQYDPLRGFVGRHAVPIHLDWPTLAFVVLVAPLAVMAVTLAGAWVRDRLRRTRPLVFAFAD